MSSPLASFTVSLVNRETKNYSLYLRNSAFAGLIGYAQLWAVLKAAKIR